MVGLESTFAPISLGLLENHWCWKSLEDFTGIDRKYWRIGTVGLVVVLAVLHFAGSILIGLLSWVYPAYASFKALETPEKKSDKHWLIYWTVIAFVHTGLSILDHLLFWVPFYSLLKFGFFIWLTMPWFGGAKILYVQAIRPWLLWAEKDIDERAKGLRQQLGHAATDVAHQLLHREAHGS